MIKIKFSGGGVICKFQKHVYLLITKKRLNLSSATLLNRLQFNLPRLILVKTFILKKKLNNALHF